MRPIYGRLSDNLDSSTHKIECDRKLKEENIQGRSKEGEEEEETSPSVERIDTYYTYVDIDEVSRFVEIALLHRRHLLSRIFLNERCFPNKR